jgi:hypothetical protein
LVVEGGIEFLSICIVESYSSTFMCTSNSLQSNIFLQEKELLRKKKEEIEKAEQATRNKVVVTFDLVGRKVCDAFPYILLSIGFVASCISIQPLGFGTSVTLSLLLVMYSFQKSIIIFAFLFILFFGG